MALTDGGFIKKLHSLPGVDRTAEVLLHQTIEKLPRIKAIAMVIQWDDDTYDADWSTMMATELITAATVLRLEAEDELRT